MLFASPWMIVSDSNHMESMITKRVTHSYVPSYVEHESIFTQGDAELLALAAAEEWEGNGSAENPIIISGYRFYSETVQPVRIWNTDLYWIFTSNLVETNWKTNGFYLTQTPAGITRENVFRECYSAISIISCYNMTIEDNSFIDNAAYGIDQEAAFQNSIIRNNEFVNHEADAISLEDTNDIEIYANYISDALYDGIDTQNGHDILITNNTILGTGAGVRVGRRSTEIHILSNVIRNCTQYGITCNGDRCLIEKNILRDIEISGIIFSGSFDLFAEENIVNENVFIDCNSYAIQIDELAVGTIITSNDFFQSGTPCHICDNSTDTTISGNFYDTWISPDTDADMIVDYPYEIMGSAGNQDTSTRAENSNESPSDFTYNPTRPGIPLIEISLIAGVCVIVCVIIIVMRRR